MHQDRPGAWPQASAGASGGLWRAAGGATARRAAKRASLVIGACGRHGATAWALLLRKLRGCGATAAGPGPPEQLLSVWAGADRGTDRGSAAGRLEQAVPPPPMQHTRPRARDAPRGSAPRPIHSDRRSMQPRPRQTPARSNSAPFRRRRRCQDALACAAAPAPSWTLPLTQQPPLATGQQGIALAAQAPVLGRRHAAAGADAARCLGHDHREL